MLIYFQWLGNRLQQALYRSQIRISLAQVAADNGKFIAPDAGHLMGFTHRLHNPLAHLHDDTVTPIFAILRIQGGKIVQINIRYGKLCAVGYRTCHDGAQQFQKHRPIRQPRERIVRGNEFDLPLVIFLSGNVLHRTDGDGGFSLGIEFKFGTFTHPNDRIIGGNPVFDVVGFALERTSPRIQNPFAVFGVNALYEILQSQGLSVGYSK